MITANDLLFGPNNERPVFNDGKDIKSWVQNKLLPLGIFIVIERSDNHKIVFKCKSYRYSSEFKRARQTRVSKKQKLILKEQGLFDSFQLKRKQMQKKAHTCDKCPFRIRANYSTRTNKWSIALVNGQHNHPLRIHSDAQLGQFNEDYFVKDIQNNLDKNKLLVTPVLPEMVADTDEYEETCYSETLLGSAHSPGSPLNGMFEDSPVDFTSNSSENGDFMSATTTPSVSMFDFSSTTDSPLLTPSNNNYTPLIPGLADLDTNPITMLPINECEWEMLNNEFFNSNVSKTDHLGHDSSNSFVNGIDNYLMSTISLQ